ncbi:MAG: MATE family efflux transporter [Microcoleaceae cyanobacterium]
MRYRLTEGPVGVQLVKLTLPMVWGVFAVIAFNLVDTYFVGQLGTAQLAAMSFTFPVVMVFGSLAIGLGIGASSVIARAIGEGDRNKVQLLTTNSLTLSVLIVGVFVIIGFATIDPLFKLLGASSALLPLIREYMEIWYLGMICLVVPMVGNSAIRAAGDTKIPSLIMTLAAVVNIGLDPLLIFGWGEIPALGLKGAALATVISRSTTLMASLMVLHFRERMILWSLSCFKQVWGCWQEILKVSLPAAGTNIISPISIGIITSLLAQYSPEVVAGFGISSRIEAFALIVLMAISATMGPFVGQNWGAKQYHRVNRALHLSFIFCIGWGVFLAVVLWIGAPWMITRFDDNPEVVATATQYLKLVPLSYSAMGVFLVGNSAFNALGKPIPALIMTLTRMIFLYIPLAYLGNWILGLKGIFIAALIANLGVGLGTYIWTQKICKANKLLTVELMENPAIEKY